MLNLMRFAIGTGVVVLAMPSGARVVTVATQKGQAFLWAIADEQQPVEERMFASITQGGSVGKDDTYVGYYHTHDGNVTVHVVEIAE